MCGWVTLPRSLIFLIIGVFLMSNGKGDVDPFRSAVASASAEVSSDSDTAPAEVDPFRSAVASASAEVSSDSDTAPAEVDPFQAPKS
jgi:hypothetical protein